MIDINDQVIAEYCIRQLHARYCDSVWRQDWETFGDCMTEDCEWKIGGVTLNGRQYIVDYMRELFETKFRRLFVTLRTPLLDVRNGAASGRTYMSAQNIMADGSAFTPFGVYYEHFTEIAPQQWRFSWRLFQTLYAGPSDLSGKFFDQEQFGPSPNMPPRDVETINVTGLHTNT